MNARTVIVGINQSIVNFYNGPTEKNKSPGFIPISADITIEVRVKGA